MKRLQALLMASLFTAGTAMALGLPQQVRNRQGQTQGQGSGPHNGTGQKKMKGKQTGPRDGTGPIHTPGTGGGNGGGGRRGRR